MMQLELHLLAGVDDLLFDESGHIDSLRCSAPLLPSLARRRIIRAGMQ
jgi:hypothetical protein